MKRAENKTYRATGRITVLLLILAAAEHAPAQVVNKPLTIRRSRATGLASFMTAADGGTIPVAARVRGGQTQAIDFLRDHGGPFGVKDPDHQLQMTKSRTDRYGGIHSTFQETHKGIPVFSAEIKVHQNSAGAFYAANGDFHPISPGLDTNAGLTPEQAAASARAALTAGRPQVEHSELVIVDPGWYGDPPIGDHLAYYLILADPAVPLREAFFVDAHTGTILDQWNLMETMKDRVVLDDSQAGTPVVRTENDPPTGDPEADGAFDWGGELYDYLLRAFGRDSVDAGGGTLVATVHYQSSSCPNAYGGISTRYCTGVVTDDIVAHEFTHGLTAFTAGLIYQNQSGQLNESFSDVFGEMVDLFNGNTSLPGPPGGTPLWPATPSGSGTDTPNSMRGAGCIGGVSLEVNNPAEIAGTYAAGSASFGPALTETGITGDVAVADPVLACDVDMPFNNPAALSGRIVLVDRGSCSFNEKVQNAQDAGAIGVIVANDSSGPAPGLGGSNPGVTIPSVGMTQDDGNTIKNAALSSTVNVTMKANGAADSVRWLVSEDSSAFGGHIRDMWWPSCEGDPDTANHPFETCSSTDNGGVHSGSGVPNHAFAILTDGKTFNGQSVTGIGLVKAGAVWYRALTAYLTAAADFEDAYYAFNQAAADLVGESVFDPRDGSFFATFTAADAAEVDKALLAVEMNTDGACGASVAVLEPNTPNRCFDRDVLFSDDFESGVGGWTVSNTGPSGPPTPYDWVQTSGGLPFGHPGTVWFAADPSIGDCAAVDESAVHSLFSPTISLPGSLSSPTLKFNHYVATEPSWDGGNIKISVNGGSWTLIPLSAMTFNGYNGQLNSFGNTNPLAGERSWTGAGGGWGTTIIDLSGFVSGGEDVQFRFDLGKDGCTGITGWFLDDLELYLCPPQLSSFSQIAESTGESIPSNAVRTGGIRGQANQAVDGAAAADDFLSDGRPVSGMRWWGSDLGTSVVDGWFVAFHKPAVVAMPAEPALAVYFCDHNVVSDTSSGPTGCDGQSLNEYAAALADCCLVDSGVDPRSGNTPGEPLAFLAESCLDYGVTVQAVAGSSFVQNELGECVEEGTGNAPTEDFWGWRTAGVDSGEGPAVIGPFVLNNTNWDFGPVSALLPACGSANMAFEILTTEVGPGDCNGNQLPDACEPDCNGSGAPDDCDLANCDGSPGCSDCNKNGVPDSCDIVGGSEDANSNGVPDECEPVGDPSAAPYPHDRRKNRYISFDPNKAENDGIDIAFRVELLAITMGSCNGNGGFCRDDRGGDDCNACSADGNPCINQPIDCAPMPPQTCDPTGDTCVNDAPDAGGTNVGRVWWIGPESPLSNGVHLLVSEPFRKVSDNWPNPVHAGDCEVVPEAAYGIRAVNTNTETPSAQVVVETTLFASISSSLWADCVGPLQKFCGGDIRLANCGSDEDCTPPATCDLAWTLPDGAVNFDDVSALLALVAPGPGSVQPDMTWVDVHGNDSGAPGSQNFDPPNYVANFADVAQVLFGFQGLPYKGYDPADCPDVANWP